MVKWGSAQGASDAPEGDARTDQFEVLRDYILDEYYRLEKIKGDGFIYVVRVKVGIFNRH